MIPQEPTKGSFIKGLILGLLPGAIVLIIVSILGLLAVGVFGGRHVTLILLITQSVIGAALAYGSGFWKRPLTSKRGFLIGLVIGYSGAIAVCSRTGLEGR